MQRVYKYVLSPDDTTGDAYPPQPLRNLTEDRLEALRRDGVPLSLI